ncbi:MAG: hypothetical protein KJ069_24350 [Anaerolineae bacterium]|nr:hypothetical protein [Anaerolineae bacterium]
MASRIPYYHDLLEAFAEPGCALCRLLAVSADKLVDSILYEGVNDVPTREQLNAARGYCQPHAQLLIRAGSALGATIMMDGVLKVLLRALAANPVEQVGASRARSLLRRANVNVSHTAVQKLVAELSPQAECPVCVNEAEMLGHYGRTLHQHLAPDNELFTTYAGSDGLCLAHFRAVLMTGLPGPALAALVMAQQTVWQRLHEQSEEFIRKNDHRFRGEPFGVEEDVWQRSLTAVSGAPIRSYVKPRGLTQS